MSWKEFQEDAPDIASLAYEKLHGKIAYLAILKKDGSPRINPVTPFIGNGMLFIFTEPYSPKIHYLHRDGRYALNCSVGGEGPLVEVLLSGEVQEITYPAIRAQAEKIASSPVVQASYILFEFHVWHALLVSYDELGQQNVQRWEKK
jgi:hypothetical protein